MAPSLYLALTALLGCGTVDPYPPEPEGWADEVKLPVLADRNPDPSVVEVDIEASIGKAQFRESDGPIDVWTYNGSTPGPTIRAKVGDTLIIHFKNNLPEETTIHWHGLRVPAEMDGTEISQTPVPSGGTFDYKFKLPDAGTYWYHPHIRSHVQVEKGLYGAIVVEDPAEPPLGNEAVLILDDLLVDDTGQIVPPEKEGDLEAFFGREGNLLLVNGRWRPTIRATPGVPLRLRLIDAANSRYFKLGSIAQRFTRVGGDGGLLQAPLDTETVMVSPGERADVVLTPDGINGDLLEVTWIPYDRGYGTGLPDPQPLFYLKLEGKPTGNVTPTPQHFAPIAPLDISKAKEQLVQLTEEFTTGNPVMGINGHPPTDMVELMAKVGEPQIWTVENTTKADHPFHLHGFRFQVLDIDGAPAPYPEWKDTFNMQAKKKARLAVEFDDRPGMWMFHCHILDHQKLGMMGMLMVMK